MAEDIVSTKTCSRCRETKNLSEVYLFRCNGYEQVRCKDCHRELTRANNERIKQDPEKLAKKRETGNRNAKLYRDTHPEFHERKKAYQREHYRNNKEQYYVRVSARKARKDGAGGSHSSEAWRQMLELFGNKCLCCGATERIVKDHVIPLLRGGSDDVTNLQPLCWRCNKSKFTRGNDYRTRDKVVLAELNEVGKLLFESVPLPVIEAAKLEKHKPRSRFTGVIYDPKCPTSVKVWRARIQVDNKMIDLGRHATEEDAARAYNEASREHFGEHAYVNDIG